LRQGWKLLSLCAALTLFVAIAPVESTARPAKKNESSAEVEQPVKKSLRQFTGFITSVEKETFTVEKRTKKNTRTMSFNRHAEMRVDGNLEEGAKVTVYYRTDGKHDVAHRVVVKVPPDEETGE